MGLLSKHKSKAAETTPVQAAPIPTPTLAPATAPEVMKTVEAVAVRTTPVAAPAPKAAPATRAVTTYDPFAIITGAGAADVDSVLAMIADAAAESKNRNFDGPFPMVALGKGNSTSGGKWQTGGNVEPADRAIMPVADKPFTGVFLGFRLYGVAWAEQMLSGDGKVNGALTPNAAPAAEDKSQPIWKVQIGCADSTLIQLAMRAGEVYQYTKGAEKGKFDGLGHFRPGVEMLFFAQNPVNDAPVVFAVKLPDNFTSTQRALESLGKTMAGLGGLRAAPLVVSPYTTQESGKVAWSCHSVRIEAAATKEGYALWKAYEAIKGELLADAEFVENFKAWNASDASPEAEAALTAISGMGR